MSWGSSGLAWADALSAPSAVTAYIDHVPDQDDGAAGRLQPRVAAAVVDVFVYVVVLNLFVEYLPPGNQRDIHPLAAHSRPAERRSGDRRGR